MARRVIIIASIVLALAIFIWRVPLRPEPAGRDGQVISTTMTLSSPAFEHNGKIPKKYTCDGENINPELRIKDVPPNAKSLALIMDDPDAPGGTFTHWVLWNIPVFAYPPSPPESGKVPRGPLRVPLHSEVYENSVPGGSIQGITSFGDTVYDGPCPPRGAHRYFFRLYALDTVLNILQVPDIPAGVSRSELEHNIKNHILDQAELIGIYER